VSSLELIALTVAQLKVNLRPLWSSAAEAIASLSQRFGDLVWDIVFNELRFSSEIQEMAPAPLWAVTELPEPHADSDTWEEERSWRDPSAHKLRKTVARWLDETRRTDFLMVCLNVQV
jgi:U3 small nucleolar RNA-associated protein 20